MNTLNQQAQVLTAYGILPQDTPLLTFAPQTFGCRARLVSSAIWEVTLDNALVNGAFLFFWGPCVVNAGTSGALTSVTISGGGSTDKVKIIVMNTPSDICFQFYQIPTI